MAKSKKSNVKEKTKNIDDKSIKKHIQSEEIEQECGNISLQ